MLFGDVILNYWAVLVATVVSFVIGFLWYGPLFGKIWAKEMGISEKEMNAPKKGMWKMMIANFVGTLITVYVLAHFLVFLEAKTAIDAIQLGFWIWLGFFLTTTMLGGILWEKKSFTLFWINAIYWLVILDVASLILILWK